MSHLLEMISGTCFYSAPLSRSGYTLTRLCTELFFNRFLLDIYYMKVDSPCCLTMAPLPLVTAHLLCVCSQQCAE